MKKRENTKGKREKGRKKKKLNPEIPSRSPGGDDEEPLFPPPLLVEHEKTTRWNKKERA